MAIKAMMLATTTLVLSTGFAQAELFSVQFSGSVSYIGAESTYSSSDALDLFSEVGVGIGDDVNFQIIIDTDTLPSDEATRSDAYYGTGFDWSLTWGEYSNSGGTPSGAAGATSRTVDVAILGGGIRTDFQDFFHVGPGNITSGVFPTGFDMMYGTNYLWHQSPVVDMFDSIDLAVLLPLFATGALKDSDFNNSEISLSFFTSVNSDPTLIRAYAELTSVTVSQVPIPSAVWLFGSGLIGLIGLARRKV